ncbi:hypothetical protein E2C01_093170 [Portunus trituberculatus]|uniref:Uncharacterized protein n=1 Tax=Portunus trituberculatus TaxID=210409 RepID=A0A5B7JZU0_PORTR|nr:hypothetical protein [Portunus trituberculatus]
MVVKIRARNDGGGGSSSRSGGSGGGGGGRRVGPVERYVVVAWCMVVVVVVVVMKVPDVVSSRRGCSGGGECDEEEEEEEKVRETSWRWHLALAVVMLAEEEEEASPTYKNPKTQHPYTSPRPYPPRASPCTPAHASEGEETKRERVVSVWGWCVAVRAARTDTRYVATQEVAGHVGWREKGARGRGKGTLGRVGGKGTWEGGGWL